MLISASAVGYYGDAGDAELRESAPCGQDFLSDLCASWEHEAMRAEEFGCRVVALRTGIVLGQGGGALEKLAPVFRMGLGGRIGSGKQFVPWIHLVDLLRIINQCVSTPEISGPVNAVGPTPVTNRLFTKALAAAVGKAAVLPVPGPILRLAMGQASATLLQGQRAVPAKLRKHHFTFSYPTLPLALRDLFATEHGPRISRLHSRPSSEYVKARRPTYELTQTTLVDAPLEEVCEFFSRAENLGILTPPNVDFAITSDTPCPMHAGAEISYTIRLGRIPIQWRTQIEAWQKNERFVDVQLKGPYRCWWHEHSFRADGQRTIMEDRVVYALPLGPLGRVAHRLFVARMLREIFSYRTRAIALRFGIPKRKASRSQRRLEASSNVPHLQIAS